MARRVCRAVWNQQKHCLELTRNVLDDDCDVFANKLLKTAVCCLLSVTQKKKKNKKENE